jgi:transcriptional regulator with XRE-family HTH domain
MAARSDHAAAAAMGKRIREIRRARHWTQAYLASRVPCSAGSVCYYENGRYTPRRRRLFRLATLLDCSVEWLEGKPGAEDPIPLSEDSSALRLAAAAHAAAIRERLHCLRYVYRMGGVGGTGEVRAHQCRLWAYHAEGCNDYLEPEDPDSSHPPKENRSP